MSSGSGVLLGAQRPRVALVPKSVSSDSEDAVFLASEYGLTPDEWQCFVLDAWFGRLRSGKWAAGQCGLAVPRQNGKNALIEVRELFGMVELGEKILHTAHEVKTARKAFARLQYFFGKQAADPGAKFPELNALVRVIRETNGQESIHLHNGASVEFVARSRGSGRGFTVDVLVLDEAQELSDEHLEALMPTISAAPQANPQVIYTGTPPGPGMGEVFTRIREAGNAGKNGRLAWHEWSALGRVDIFDPAVWAEANPAFGIRLQRSVIEDELAAMSPEGFAKERLGKWFAPGESGGPFPDGSWLAGIPVDASFIPVENRVVFCLDVSIDRTWSHIGVAGLRADGFPHVELVASRAGTDWPVDWFADKVARDGPLTLVVQARGAPVSSLIPELEAIEGVTVVEWGGPELGNATGQIFDAVKRNLLRHNAQPGLDVAAATAHLRMMTDGGSAWDRRRSPVDIGPLVAVTGALWGLNSAPAPFRSKYEDASSSLLVLG